MFSQEQNFPAVGFSLPDFKFKKRKKNLYSFVYVFTCTSVTQVQLLISLTKSTAFFMFSLHLKRANLSVFWDDGSGGGGRVVLFNHFARPP